MSEVASILCSRWVYDAILADCAARYPTEACGILIGRDDDDGRRIVEARPAANVWDAPNEQTRRYLIDPAAQLAAERDAAAGGLAVIGFYHSHPDADPIPSPRDAAVAWPFYSYMIVRTPPAGSGEAKCWMFDDIRHAFRPQAMTIH